MIDNLTFLDVANMNKEHTINNRNGDIIRGQK